jgi:hypothetical protein
MTLSNISVMAQCTAPKEGHRTASAAANCPACRYRSRYVPSYSTPSSHSSGSVRGSSGTSGGTSTKVRAPWSGSDSTVLYTPAQVRELTPVRENIVKQAELPDLRDVFLCHAWDDRKEAAKELHDLLEARGVSVWFSEKDIVLGTPFLREIDRGLAKSKVGIVLVTPALLRRLPNGNSVADKELSALLQGHYLVPVVHNTTYEALREVSPLLASRDGLNTKNDTLETVAAQIADLVSPLK